MPSVHERLDAVILTRQLAADSLHEALSDLLDSPGNISESALRDLWLSGLRKHSSIYNEGWYNPPPNGLAVLFGTSAEPERVSPKSLRPREYWSRDDVYLDRQDGLIMLYASPVDRATGMIGDFGLTLYLGQNPQVKSMLVQTLAIDQELFAALRIGMPFSVLANQAAETMRRQGLFSALESPTDPTGTNIGHTIPASDSGWKPDEWAIFRQGNWAKTKDMISHKRVFINRSESSTILSDMAHTLEPRPQSFDHPDLPTVWFHNIVVWRDGQKQLLSGFDDLFSLAGMGYMK